jgi:type IV secretion system protein VirB10
VTQTQAASAPIPDTPLRFREDHPEPKRLSRKVLMAGAATMGLVIAFSLLTGLSSRERANASEANDTAIAAAPMPEGLSTLPTRYGVSAIAEESAPLEPRDLMWGDNALPEGFEDPYAFEDSETPTMPDGVAWSGNESDAHRAGSASQAPAAQQDAIAPLFFEPRKTSMGSDARVPQSGSRSRETRDGASRSQTEVSFADTDLTAPRSPYTLHAGTVIPAALMTAVNSDLPGRVIAQVTAPVYDSVTGDHLLIPQGTRLIGTYSSETTYGDTRVFLAWDRMILPNGGSLDLGEMDATDSAGASGLPAKVDNHLDRIGGAVAISAVLRYASGQGRGLITLPVRFDAASSSRAATH